MTCCLMTGYRYITIMDIFSTTSGTNVQLIPNTCMYPDHIIQQFKDNSSRVKLQSFVNSAYFYNKRFNSFFS